MIPTARRVAQAVSNSGETDKYLYLQMKSATVSPFYGFGGIGRVMI
jgi:hypothetical protein